MVNVEIHDPAEILAAAGVQPLVLASALDAVLHELHRAVSKHPPFPSVHHGYAVMAEELDEVWEAVKADDLAGAQREAVQVAATALRFLLDTRSPAAVKLVHEGGRHAR